ncbi:MAG: hypothetical protein WKG07_37000 [Hymenobacter sp.]
MRPAPLAATEGVGRRETVISALAQALKANCVACGPYYPKVFLALPIPNPAQRSSGFFLILLFLSLPMHPTPTGPRELPPNYEVGGSHPAASTCCLPPKCGSASATTACAPCWCSSSPRP